MFVVYSPEGQSAIAAAQLKPELRVDPTKKVPAVGETLMEETHLSLEDSKGSAVTQSALKQYRSVQTADHGKPLVIASEVMSSPVMTISAEATLEEAWVGMSENQIHHLPVLNTNQQLVGMISATEILEKAIVGLDGQLEEIRGHLVGDLMMKQVISTYPNTDIRKVALVMSNYHIGSVVIINQEGVPQGIVTLSDLVKRLSEEPPLTLYA